MEADSSIRPYLYAGFILRLCLIIYGEYQDMYEWMGLKFTDVDYRKDIWS